MPWPVHKLNAPRLAFLGLARVCAGRLLFLLGKLVVIYICLKNKQKLVNTNIFFLKFPCETVLRRTVKSFRKIWSNDIEIIRQIILRVLIYVFVFVLAFKSLSSK